MALSLGGSKNKSKSSQQSTMDQTSSTSLSDRAYGSLTDRIAEVGGQKYQSLDPSAYKDFSNPYEDDVIAATVADITAGRDAEANQQRQAMLARGALGSSDRRGVREAELADKYDRTTATTVGGLRSAGFNAAQGVAQAENANRNQFDAQTQARIDQLLALLGQETTTRTTGKSTGSGTGSGYSFGGGWSSAPKAG